jgi:ABC-type sugar transport system permease subunit
MTRRVPLWLALPAIAGLVLFLAYPTGYLIALALTDSSLANPLRAFSGADNFASAVSAAPRHCGSRPPSPSSRPCRQRSSVWDSP